MISQQLPIKIVSILIFFVHFMVKSPKTNATPTPFKTPNKPNFSDLRIAVSDLLIRTKDYKKRTAEGKNKAKQPHLIVYRRFWMFWVAFSGEFSYTYSDFMIHAAWGWILLTHILTGVSCGGCFN